MEAVQYKRLGYIDLFKGILISMVVLGHIVYLLGLYTGIDVCIFPFILVSAICNDWIAPYYMASFFFVTGYCSTFNKSMKDQIVIDFKRLVVPAVVIPIIMNIIIYLLCADIKTFIPKSLPWFLMALFLSKLIFKYIKDLNIKLVVKWCVLFFLLGIGVIGMNKFKSYNFFSLFQACCFTIFISMGYYLKKYQPRVIFGICALGIYMLCVILSKFILGSCPSLCDIITFNLKQTLLYVLMAMSGTISLGVLSHYIGQSKILEYLGKNSLVIYLTHFSFLIIVPILFKEYIIQYYTNVYFAYLLIISIFIGACLWGCMWSVVFKLKTFKWIIGKN